MSFREGKYSLTPITFFRQDLAWETTMQCGLCGEEISEGQAHHFMADVGKVHRTCRKAFDRGLLAAADLIKRHGKASGSGSVDSRVVDEEIRAATSEYFDGE